MTDAHAESNPNPPAVELEHVTKRFGGRNVLDDVSLRVDAGKAFCLLGRSGTGKSVTLKVMIGLIQPDHGRVLIEGTPMQHRDKARLSEMRKKIGFLFQNAALFDSISVADNVAFPLRRHTHKPESEIEHIVQQKLKEVELENEGRKMPSELSGGMRKRAGLARALALDPSIVFVDEPSSGLDRITATEIYHLLLRLKERRQVTLVAVTHDVAGVKSFADQFAVLDQGRIAGCGTADELMRGEHPLFRRLAGQMEE